MAALILLLALVTAPASSLTLADAIARARTTSPTRAAAELRLGAASSAANLVSRAPNPLVELRSENWGAGSRHTTPRDTFAVVSQTVELGGKYGARRLEALAAADVARSGVAVTDLHITMAVAERYVAAVRSRDTRAVLGEQRDSLTEIVRILTQRVREGTGAEADLRRFESEQTRVVHEMARASIVLDRELAMLSALIGVPVSADQLVQPSLPALEVQATPLTEARIARRADVGAARAEAQRLDAAVAVERSLAVPDLILSGGYKGTAGLRTAVAAVAVAVPLFDRNAAAVARAAGEARAARLDADYLQRQALAVAEAQWTAARRLLDQAALADATLLAPAAIVRTAARSAFVEGAGDVLRLVDAERGYADAAREALELRLDAVLAFVHARLSIGEEPLP